jgi:hypothetical protein
MAHGVKKLKIEKYPYFKHKLWGIRRKNTTQTLECRWKTRLERTFHTERNDVYQIFYKPDDDMIGSKHAAILWKQN